MSSSSGDARAPSSDRGSDGGGDDGGDSGRARVGRSAWGAWALLVAVGIAIVLVVPRSEWFQISFLPAAYADSDYELHWAASQALIRGQDPYDQETVAPFGAATGRTYTPFCAAFPLMVRLFALTGGKDVEHFEEGYRATRAINLGLLLVSVLLLAGVLRNATCGRASVHAAAALAAAAGLLAFNDGTWMALHYNQLNFLALAAVCGALCAAQRGRPGAEGALLAVAALAKTSPALLIVVAAMAGRWRTVRAAALTAVALGALSVAWNGWAAHVSWLAMVDRELGYVATLRPGFFNNSLHAWNLSPNGALSRAGNVAGWSSAIVRAAVWAVTVTVLATLWIAVRRSVTAGRSRADSGDAEARALAARILFAQYALGVCASVLVSSVTWSPHLSLAVVPALWFVQISWSGPAPHVKAWLLAGGLAYAMLCLPLGTFGTPWDVRRDVDLKLAACALLFLATWFLAADEPLNSPRHGGR